MALPSQTRREQLKKGARQRRPARLSRTVRLALAAVAGIGVVLIALRVFAWPAGRAAASESPEAAAAAPGVQEIVDHRAGEAAAPEAAVLPAAPAASAPDAGLEPALVQEVLASASADPSAGASTPDAMPLSLPDSPSARKVQEAMAIMETNRPVEARLALTAILQAELDPADEAFLRDTLAVLNRRLVFSPEVVAGDAFSRMHTVGRGEVLSTIVRTQKLQVDWRFILRVNGIPSERYLREGQRLKLVSGPFEAVVDKSDFRMDLDMGRGPDRVYVASLPVGLGEYDSTPVGRFRVHSRTPDPAWANPRTGERFAHDDPMNPIGEHWIGLQGIDEGNRDLQGYGIHGTIDPASIGQQRSMGCVRMLPGDVALVYEVLLDGCAVEIRP